MSLRKCINKLVLAVRIFDAIPLYSLIIIAIIELIKLTQCN